MRKLFILPFILLFALPCLAQSWSNVLSPSRAINWTGAGLPATLPDGETTANPWTPPVRTQCTTAACNTLSGGTVTAASINAALASASHGQYVLIPAGNFTLINNTITMYLQNGVTLRGSGPQSTTLTFAGTTYIAFAYAAYGNGFCTSASSTTIASGTTSITATGCSGNAPQVGEVMTVQQCDSGYSGVSANPITVGTGCANGSSYDNGALYVCGNNIACQRSGESTGTPYVQTQTVYLSAVTNNGGGSYTLTYNNGLYLPNWGATINSNFATPFVSWSQGATGPNVWGDAIEDMTIYETADNPNGNTSGNTVYMNNSYACWIKGVRFLSVDTAYFPPPLGVQYAKNNLVINNYFFTTLSMSGLYGPTEYEANDSDTLSINNLFADNPCWIGYGSEQGDVIAYNYCRDAFSMDTNGFFEHGPAGINMLYEANDVDSDEDDNTHGTHDLNTRFREHIRGAYPPYVGASDPSGFTMSATSRMENLIGNSIGDTRCSSSPNNCLTTYTLNQTAGTNYVFSFGYGASASNDPLVETTSMRWGNVDYTNGGAGGTPFTTAQFNSSEVPTTLSGAAVPFENSVPSNHNLPCSFFLAGYTSTTCSAHPSGGTGLSFWKVCTTWATFPTSCSATSTPAFPPIGPDVSGGIENNGTVYDLPTVVAWKNLPIDTTYQSSYTITASSWSGGSETLTISGFPNVQHLMGGFQISGGSGSCIPSSGVSYTGRADNEILMTNSTVTTVVYALASNPGANACAGTFKFPDVRRFDERVYQNDPAGVTLSPSSENFGSINVGSSSSAVTFTLTNNSASTATSISPTTTGGNSIDFSISNTGAGSCNAAGNQIAASASCTFTVTFSPTASGSRSTTLSVSYSGGDGASPQTSALSGTGTTSSAVGTSMSGGAQISGSVKLQ
jgi:hypothetical protein